MGLIIHSVAVVSVERSNPVYAIGSMATKRDSSWIEGKENDAGYKIQKVHDMEDSSDEEVEEVERNYEDYEDEEGDQSSSDDGGYKEDSSEESEDDIKIEAFNMKKEFRQGKFNEVGAYIKNDYRDNDGEEVDDEDDVNNIEDEVLKSVDQEAIKKAYDAEQERLTKIDDVKERDLKSSIMVLCEYMKNGESVGMCMQRLYSLVKKHKKKVRGKKSGNKEVESKESKAIEDITESVVVLEKCEYIVRDVLSLKKEELEKLV